MKKKHTNKIESITPDVALELMHSYHHLPDDNFTPVQYIIRQMIKCQCEVDDVNASAVIGFFIKKIFEDKLLDIELKRGTVKIIKSKIKKTKKND